MSLLRRFILSFFFILFLGFNTKSVLAQFSGGIGTSSSPYQISTCTQLEDVGTSAADYFVLTQNIDCSATSTWDLDTGDTSVVTYFGFDPIPSFSGNFDGQNYTISNLYINRPSYYYVGLFDTILNGGIVKNLNLTGVNITGSSTVGGITGEVLDEGYVSNLSVGGSVVGGYNVSEIYYIGGIIGVYNASTSVDTTVSNLSFNGVVEGLVNIGGIIGLISSGSQFNRKTVFSNLFSSGIVKSVGSGDVGGLIGHVADNNSSIINSHSTSNVTGLSPGLNSGSSGGLIGVNRGLIKNSYSTGNVIGRNFIGGLIGMNYSNNITNSYATGNVSGVGLTPVYIGGFLGLSDNSVITNCFSVGTVNSAVGISSYVGGFIGVLNLKLDIGLTKTVDSSSINNGWKTDGVLDAIGRVATSIGPTIVFFGSTSIQYNETDNTVFYSKNHGVYAQDQSTAWDFTTPIWHEVANDYPNFITPEIIPPSNNSSSNSNPGASTYCGEASPVTSPDLFQITAGGNKATLFYSPPTSKVTGYMIMYGYKEGDERFGTTTNTINNNQGVQTLTVYNLEVGKTYYFKVAAQNGCAISPWSKWMSVKITNGTTIVSSTNAKELPKTGVMLPTVILGLVSLVLTGGSLFLFKIHPNPPLT